MSSFSYAAKLPDGRKVTGSMDAASNKGVIEALHQKGFVVLEVKALAAQRSSFFSTRVGPDDLAIFSRQMATLVDAGIPIVAGLEAVADQVENPTLRKVILNVKDAVEGGTNLTSAIGRESKVFSPLFVSMVRAGEISGHLAEVLQRLAVYLEKSASLQRKVKSACIYPAIVIGMAVVITGVLVLTVIPAFKEIFSTMGAQLPLPTRLLLAFSDFSRRFFLPIVGSLIAGVIVFRRKVLRTKPGRLWFDRLMLRLPIVGVLIRKVAIAKFARTLATLVKSGVQILSALEIVSETAGNRVIADALIQVKNSIREGENIAAPLAASKAFPPMVVRMIAVGEQTGRLDEMLSKVADFYEEQVDASVNGLTSALEPLIICVLGVVVGSIVFAIFLPIFKMASLAGGHR
ncbi:MAG: type II secretion system F family protein [Candidatus Omnitrophota bacterium]|nr:type II secretion system F family protein [Candidatus Omnitrophota bacterium]